MHPVLTGHGPCKEKALGAEMRSSPRTTLGEPRCVIPPPKKKSGRAVSFFYYHYAHHADALALVEALVEALEEARTAARTAARSSWTPYV